MEVYLENPYWQHFCGEVYFQYKLPFYPSDFVHFRKRIGEEGMKKIFRQSIDLFDADMMPREVIDIQVNIMVLGEKENLPDKPETYRKGN